MNTTPRPRRAKYCPQCHTMALMDAPGCAHCGHTFSTGLVPDAVHQKLSDQEMHKTRMFTLPSVAPRAEPVSEDALLPEFDPSTWKDPDAPRERMRRILVGAALGLIFALLAALWWYQLHHL